MKKASSVFLAVTLGLCVCAAHTQENSEVYLSVSKAALKGLPRPADALVFYVPRAQSAAASSAGALLETASPVMLRRANGSAGLATAGLRGFTSKQTAVLYDGMRIPADLTGTVDLSALPAANIERVEILPGPWSCVQGANAEGGVINFVSRGPRPGISSADMGTILSSYGGLANTVSLMGSNKRFSGSASAAREAADGFQRNGGSRKEFFSGKASLALGERGRLSFTGLRSNSENGVPGGTPVPVQDWDGSRERLANSLTDLQRTSLGLARAALELPVSENVSYTLSAESGVNRIFSHSAWSDELTRTLSHRGLLSFSFFGKAEAGVEYEKILLKSDAYGDHYKQHAGLFSQLTLTPLKDLSVVPSLRFDRNVGYADQASPRLAVIYAPDFVWKFSAQTGRAWQAPTFADLYNPWVPAADRSPDLRPEYSWQTQAAVSASFAAGFRASLGAYYADVRDRIALDASRSWAAYNLDSAFNEGLEAGLEYKGRSFAAGAGYVHNVSKGRTTGGYKALSFSPRHRVSLNAAVRTPWLDIRSKGYYSARQYTAADNGGLKLPAYFTADLYLSKTLDMLEIFAGADNLFDGHYAQTADTINGYYPLPGRVLKCGLSVRFI
jgi:outer membrane receptor protein involved in Fe transport